jgi:peptidoglycan/xylan/chitin deacetylase (PgdA/CDA1 family)
MKVLQCWDDGLVDDIRLTGLLRRHGARAAFALNPGLYGPERSFGWRAGEREVRRLALPELARVYDGFEIASHALTHPYLTDLPPDRLWEEVAESRRRLEDLFRKPVRGFIYPFNAVNDAVRQAVRAAGYAWTREDGEAGGAPGLPPPRVFRPACHALAEDFWPRYDAARARGGAFFFWGHSCDLGNEAMWRDFERKIAAISADPEAEWCDPGDVCGSV